MKGIAETESGKHSWPPPRRRYDRAGSPIPTLPPPVGQAIGNLAAGLEQQDVIIDTTETARELGVTLTPAETVLRQMFDTASATH